MTGPATRSPATAAESARASRRDRATFRRLCTGVVLGALVGASMAGCAGGSDPLAPPEIVYGEDICDQCGMIISDARFAAATLVEVDGRTEPRRFDDVADMFAYHRSQPELPVRRWYVHDYETETWLDASTAFYAQGVGVRSPMGGGIAAFATEERAAAFAATVHGTLVTFESLLGQDPAATASP